MVDDDELIKWLENDWEMDAGFYWNIRQGHFDEREFEAVLRKLQQLRFDDQARIPRRVVSLLWYIPLFMHWQTERVGAQGGDVDAYRRAANAALAEIERLLGIP